MGSYSNFQRPEMVRWRARQGLQWFPECVRWVTGELYRAKVQHLWVGDAAMQVAGLCYWPERIDVVVSDWWRAVRPLVQAGCRYADPRHAQTRHVVIVNPWGIPLWVWEQAAPQGFAQNLGLPAPHQATRHPRVATPLQALQQMEAQHAAHPLMYWEERIRALRALTSPSGTSGGDGSRADS